MRPAALITVLSLLGGLVLVCIGPIPAHAQLTPELRQIGSELDALAAETKLITDLNRLQLTRDQIEALLPAVTALRASATAFEQQRVGVLRQLKPPLEQQRDLALRDAPVPDMLAAQICDIQGQLAALDRSADETLTAQAAVFRGILTDSQVAIVVGEEDARRQVLDLLDWVRAMDNETFAREAPPYAEELADPEAGLGTDEIMDLLTLARAMDEEQYARSAQEIQGKLIELFRPTAETADHIIVGVFLHQAMPTILQDKLASMTEQ